MRVYGILFCTGMMFTQLFDPPSPILLQHAKCAMGLKLLVLEQKSLSYRLDVFH